MLSITPIANKYTLRLENYNVRNREQSSRITFQGMPVKTDFFLVKLKKFFCVKQSIPMKKYPIEFVENCQKEIDRYCREINELRDALEKKENLIEDLNVDICVLKSSKNRLVEKLTILESKLNNK